MNTNDLDEPMLHCKGSVKVPQTTILGDLTDEAEITLNASYKVRVV
jgi:hypothetical protein